MSNQQNTKEERRKSQTNQENRQSHFDLSKNHKNEPHIKPSETDNNEVSSATNKAGDPGRTPGKAEG